MELPFRRGEEEKPSAHSHKLLRKLMVKQLREKTLKSNPPEFIGFVPSAIADRLAKIGAFFDSSWSLNLTHGSDTHLLQLLLLNRLGVMDHKTLTWMVENQCWGDILDQAPIDNFDSIAAPDVKGEDQGLRIN